MDGKPGPGGPKGSKGEPSSPTAGPKGYPGEKVPHTPTMKERYYFKGQSIICSSPVLRDNQDLQEFWV